MEECEAVDDTLTEKMESDSTTNSLGSKPSMMYDRDDQLNVTAPLEEICELILNKGNGVEEVEGVSSNMASELEQMP